MHLTIWEGLRRQLILENATRLDPNNSIFWTNMGWAYNELGRFDKAYDALDRAIKTDPGNKYAQSK